ERFRATSAEPAVCRPAIRVLYSSHSSTCSEGNHKGTRTRRGRYARSQNLPRYFRRSDRCVDGFLCGTKYLIHDRDPLRHEVSQHRWGFLHRPHQIAATITESECVCRTLCPHHQRILPGSDTCTMTQRLELIREKKLFRLLPGTTEASRLEASGVA